MKHISKMIDEANEAVSQIKISYMKAVSGILTRADLTMEQKQALIALLEPVEKGIDNAASKFAYDV